ncbi:MAG: TatD DNase family protein [Candidatus Berkelbacteria bacterium Licking1014_85]|uniref:TatD DNase family protein n=1 Tax=Candidatus Berkelbacteria bacterium Licking1014_85 TaxID=2017148 RepID=A0A554LIR2_9BACT|nr:MAG: TatD DNase family protein [Candidatus Berkelbacteria bacterium Licking1014_85]
MTDTHCHLSFPELYNQIDEITRSDLKMITVGVDLADSKKCVEIAEKYENVWASVGIHPIGAKTGKQNEQELKQIEELLKNKKVIAIGEVGLDDKEKLIELDDQIILLKKFIALAIKNEKPLILHSRGSGNMDKIIDLLTTFHLQGGKLVRDKLRGVLHCFTGSVKQAKKLVELGFKIGLTNIVVNCTDYDSLIRAIDLKNILLETDAPYLAPKILQTKINLPENVRFVAEKIAKIKNIDILIVEQTTDKSARELFGI